MSQTGCHGNKYSQLTGWTPGNAASMVDTCVLTWSLYEVDESVVLCVCVSHSASNKCHYDHLWVPENSFVFVLIWAWTSMPITASHPSLMNPFVDAVAKNLNPCFLDAVNLENMVAVQSKYKLTWLIFLFLHERRQVEIGDTFINRPSALLDEDFFFSPPLMPCHAYSNRYDIQQSHLLGAISSAGRFKWLIETVDTCVYFCKDGRMLTQDRILVPC